MSWDISIVKDLSDKQVPLGTREEVVAAFARSIPPLTLSKKPVPSPEILAIMPPVVRESALHPGLEAEYDVGDLYMSFFCHDESIIRWVIAEVRGNDNPLPILAAICVPNGWFVVDSYDRSLVDLSGSGMTQWDRFCAWRNGAFNSWDESGDK